MIDQIEPVAIESGAVLTCDICRATQNAATVEGPAWKCRTCGQDYRYDAPSNQASIVLSERQIQALRTLSGRNASGRSALVRNFWSENNLPVGEAFLDWNKDMPSRHLTRKLILDWAAGGEIQNVLEIAFGGLHEYRAMRKQLTELNVSYSGIDWAEHFVTHAQKEFPECRWTHGDIVRGVSSEGADVVYSQHMLEHLPALEPGFSNMLNLARKKLINIFFIPPKPFPNYEVVNWEKFPRYHNTYSIGHIETICRTMNFTCKWVPFEKNPVTPGVGLGQDVVLICERQPA
jgi:SAM-dependent methyltransferase